MAVKEKKIMKNARCKKAKSIVVVHNHGRRMTTRSCTNIDKNRVELKFEEENSNKLFNSPSTPMKNNLHKEMNRSNHSKIPRTPKTPEKIEFENQSTLESFPMEILVKILCKLHHDQLRSVFHVSHRMRCAVLEARQLHFNYTTPDRSRQEMLMTMTLIPEDQWSFIRGDINVAHKYNEALTPKAPRQGSRPSRLQLMNLKQISSALFQESTLPMKFKVPPGLPKPVYKPVASPRVLFYEDDIC